MGKGKWIARATRRGAKGSLRKWAKRHRALGKDGRINLGKARKRAMRLPKGAGRTRRLRQINFARNVRRFGGR